MTMIKKNLFILNKSIVTFKIIKYKVGDLMSIKELSMWGCKSFIGWNLKFNC